MPMMMMLLILVFIYFACLITILFFNKYMNQKYTIIFFMITNAALFAGYCINEYSRKGKFDFLTFDQISPFMFTMLCLFFLMNDKIKKVFLDTAAMLSLGMFVAGLVSPQEAYLASYRMDANMLYVLDTLLHLNCSLFGIFLVSSGQVKLNVESLKKAFIWMYSVIALVLILNFTFHLNYFGMGPYSKFGIYMFKLFDSYWVTLLVYLFGVALVLSLGYGFNLIISKLTTHNEEIIEN